MEFAHARSLFIVSDEAYEDVIYAPHVHTSVAALARGYEDHIVSILSFSKSHAVSGLRVGYLLTSHRALADRMHKFLRCSINGVNSVAQWTAVTALQGEQRHIELMKIEYAKRRDLMMSALQDIPGLRPFRPQGAFYVWARVEPSLCAKPGCKDVDGLSSLLADRGVGSAPGDAFGDSCHDAIRFAFSCATSMIEQGAPVLHSLLTA